MPARAREHVDVVVVGARPAGCAAAIALVHGGRRVIAVDRARFPSREMDWERSRAIRASPPVVADQNTEKPAV